MTERELLEYINVGLARYFEIDEDVKMIVDMDWGKGVITLYPTPKYSMNGECDCDETDCPDNG